MSGGNATKDLFRSRAGKETIDAASQPIGEKPDPLADGKCCHLQRIDRVVRKEGKTGCARSAIVDRPGDDLEACTGEESMGARHVKG